MSLGDISLDASKRLVEDLGLSRVTPLLSTSDILTPLAPT